MMPATHAEFLKPSKPVLRGGVYERSANSRLTNVHGQSSRQETVSDSVPLDIGIQRRYGHVGQAAMSRRATASGVLSRGMLVCT